MQGKLNFFPPSIVSILKYYLAKSYLALGLLLLELAQILELLGALLAPFVDVDLELFVQLSALLVLAVLQTHTHTHTNGGQNRIQRSLFFGNQAFEYSGNRSLC